jgi:hypothetical protein
MAKGDVIREMETGRFFIVDEVGSNFKVWAHRLGKSASAQRLFSPASVELVLHFVRSA